MPHVSPASVCLPRAKKTTSVPRAGAAVEMKANVARSVPMIPFVQRMGPLVLMDESACRLKLKCLLHKDNIKTEELKYEL